MNHPACPHLTGFHCLLRDKRAVRDVALTGPEDFSHARLSPTSNVYGTSRLACWCRHHPFSRPYSRNFVHRWRLWVLPGRCPLGPIHRRGGRKPATESGALVNQLVSVGRTVRISSSTAPFPEELHEVLRSIAFHERTEITALVIKALEKEYGSKLSTSGISGLVSAIP